MIPRYSFCVTAYSPDDVDMRIMEALQGDGRSSYAELARTVSMSPSAVTERVRRLEDTTGRIAGLGPVTTTVVYSSVLKNRAITGAILKDWLARAPST